MATEELTHNDLWFLFIKIKILDTGIAFPRNTLFIYLFFTFFKKKGSSGSYIQGLNIYSGLTVII